MERIRWEKLAACMICLFSAGILLYVSFRYLLAVLLPFLFGWACSLPVRPLAKKIGRVLHLPEKILAVLLFLLLIGGAGAGIGAAVGRLISEAGRLVNQLLENGDRIFSSVGELADRLERLRLFRVLLPDDEGRRETVAEMLKGVLTSFSSALPGLAARLASALPGIFLSFMVTVISGFYFCTDDGSIRRFLTGLLPDWMRNRVDAWKTGGNIVFLRYLRAYLWLLLLTFAEVFLGLCILRVEYAFLLALLIALVDFLPILGVGTVLIPWSTVLLLQKNYYLGFGLLILYAVVLIVRQIIEPKLIGKSLGLHPLAALFSGYLGFSLLGLPGMLAGPVLALLCKGLIGIRTDGNGNPSESE